MYQCPTCALQLRYRTKDKNSYWNCSKCHGNLFGLGVLKKLIGTGNTDLLIQQSEEIEKTGPACPSCTHPLRAVIPNT